MPYASLRRLAAAALAACIGLPAAMPALAQQTVPESPAQIQMSFAPVVRTAAPAVVNVYSSRTVRQQSMFQSLFGPQFGPPQERTEQSLGSGVIVASDGVIVTNNHVVEGAQELKVVLNDRREYDAELLMADARTDLAVLRIAATGLPTLDYARSSQLEVGDLVLAIGNPFGVGQSVSSGIVSALARTDVGITDYSFFIQTDAAVNPGNSGGALVDLNGDLVGVNTAIFSRSGDSSGIGFAIPSELVQRVVETALEGGVSMVRPWLGAGLQTVTPDLAASLGLDRPQGALINEIYEGGPADMAGLQIGDVITAVDGSAVNDLNAVRFLLATHRVGDTASAIVLRDAQERTVRIPVETPPDSPAPEEVRITGANPFQGAVIANLSPAFADEVGLDPLDSGVIVIDVAGRSNAGVWLRPGDKILSIGENPVRSVSDATGLLEQYDGAPVWPLAIERDGQRFEPTLRL
jgi:Do/DeqQ family serine protease